MADHYKLDPILDAGDPRDRNAGASLAGLDLDYMGTALGDYLERCFSTLDSASLVQHKERKAHLEDHRADMQRRFPHLSDEPPEAA